MWQRQKVQAVPRSSGRKRVSRVVYGLFVAGLFSVLQAFPVVATAQQPDIDFQQVVEDVRAKLEAKYGPEKKWTKLDPAIQDSIKKEMYELMQYALYGGKKPVWGLLDSNCNALVKPSLDVLQAPRGYGHDHAALHEPWRATKNGVKGYLNTTWQFVAGEPGNATVFEVDGKYGLRSANGSELLLANYDRIRVDYEHGYQQVTTVRDRKRGWGLLDADGKWVLEPYYNQGVTYGALEWVFLSRDGQPGLWRGDLNDFSIPIGRYERLYYQFAIDSMCMGAYRDGHFGVVDLDGNERLAFEYDTMYFAWERTRTNRPQQGRYLEVVKDGKFGLVAGCGELIVPTEYENVEWINPTVGGGNPIFFRTYENGKQGLVNLLQGQHGPCAFDSVAVENRHFKYLQNGQWGALGRDGQPQTKAEWDDLYIPTVNRFIVRKAGRWGAMAPNDSLLVPCKYDSVALHRSNAGFELYQGGKVGMHVLGSKTFEPAYDAIVPRNWGWYPHVVVTVDGKEQVIGLKSEFPAGKPGEKYELLTGPELRFKFSKDGKCWMVNESTKKLHKRGYDDIKRLAESYYAFLEKQLWGVMDADGKVLVKPVFDDVRYRAEGEQFFGLINLRHGTYRADGKPGIPAEYDRFETYEGDLWEVEKDGKFGIVAPDGTIVLPIEYDFIASNPGSDIIHGGIISKDGKQGAIDSTGAIVFPATYEWFLPMQSMPIVQFAANDKIGLADPAGKLIHEAQFDQVVEWRDKLLVSKDELWGVMNAKLEYIVEPRYMKVLDEGPFLRVVELVEP